MSQSITIKKNVWGIVPAAGAGQRMQTSLAKQYLKINDKTILEITASLLLANPLIKQLVICTAADDQVWSTLELSNHSNVDRVNCGASRAQSVLNGLRSLRDRADDNDWVLVHDAARPCLSAAKLNDFIQQIIVSPVGGIMAVKANDTLKLSRAESADIQQTLDRSFIWQAQTPQMFPYGLLYGALSDALNAGAEITDESSAMEWAGHAPRLVEGDSSNLKITSPDDLKMARFFLKS